MRKQNPNDVVEDFQVLIAASLSTWTQMCAQISGNELRKNASVDALLNAAIRWESFLSDWHIAAINRDSGPFVVDLQARVEQSVVGRWPGVRSRIALSIPAHPSLELVRELIDPDGGNISFGNRDKWIDRVQKQLNDPRASARPAVGNRRLPLCADDRR